MGAILDAQAVSILVLLEWSSEAAHMEQGSDKGRQFQSLFYWNGLLRSVLMGFGTPSAFGFNPCSIGMVF